MLETKPEARRGSKRKRPSKHYVEQGFWGHSVYQTYMNWDNIGIPFLNIRFRLRYYTESQKAPDPKSRAKLRRSRPAGSRLWRLFLAGRGEHRRAALEPGYTLQRPGVQLVFL